MKKVTYTSKSEIISINASVLIESNNKSKMIETAFLTFDSTGNIIDMKGLHILCDKDYNIIYVDDTTSHIHVHRIDDDTCNILMGHNVDDDICMTIRRKTNKLDIEYDETLVNNVQVSEGRYIVCNSHLANLVKFSNGDYSFAKEDKICNTLLYEDYPVAVLRVKKYDDHIKKTLLPVVHDLDNNIIGTIDLELDHVFLDIDSDESHMVFDPYSVSKDEDDGNYFYINMYTDTNIGIRCEVGGVHKFMFTIILSDDRKLYGTNTRVVDSNNNKVMIDLYEFIEGEMIYADTKEIIPLE